MILFGEVRWLRIRTTMLLLLLDGMFGSFRHVRGSWLLFMAKRLCIWVMIMQSFRGFWTRLEITICLLEWFARKLGLTCCTWLGDGN